MTKRIYIAAGAFVVIVFLVIGSGMIQVPDVPLIITGYDGIESTVYDFQHNYVSNYPETEIGLGSTVATFDPSVYITSPLDPSGVHIDIQEPNVLGYDHIDTIEQVTTETRDGNTYEVTKTWEVQIVKLEMGVHFYTTGYGYAALENVRMMIRLVENDYSVFMLPDASSAYILNVYTTRETAQYGGATNQVAPLAEGMDVELIPLATNDIPQWILDSGYTGQLTNFEDIAFPITIINMMRHSFSGMVITEAENQMWFGIDVLLFGFWEEWKDSREMVRTFPDWLGDLFLMLMTPLGIALAIVAIIGTMVVLVKAPGHFLKIFGVVAIWLAVFFVLMMFGVLAL